MSTRRKKIQVGAHGFPFQLVFYDPDSHPDPEQATRVSVAGATVVIVARPPSGALRSWSDVTNVEDSDATQIGVVERRPDPTDFDQQGWWAFEGEATVPDGSVIPSEPVRYYVNARLQAASS